jgi:hypothetical protein
LSNSPSPIHVSTSTSTTFSRSQTRPTHATLLARHPCHRRRTARPSRPFFARQPPCHPAYFRTIHRSCAPPPRCLHLAEPYTLFHRQFPFKKAPRFGQFFPPIELRCISKLLLCPGFSRSHVSSSGALI